MQVRQFISENQAFICRLANAARWPTVLFLILQAAFCASQCLAQIDSIEAEQPRVVPGYKFSFPEDHGSHPHFGTEWWYFSGQLTSEEGTPQEFGFQLTFFRKRVGGAPPYTSQHYLAHAALSDFQAKKFIHDSRRAREGPLRIGFATPGGLDVAIGRWRAVVIGDSLILGYETTRGGEEVALNLVGAFNEQPLLHGDNGYSKKGRCSECASYYYSLPRIEMRGELRRGIQRIPVMGTVWMDHEFMSNALRPTVQGWDWFSLHSKDGGSLMLFRVRYTDNERAFESGTWLPPNGKAVHLDDGSFTLRERAFWVSPHSSARYPIAWAIKVPQANIDTVVTARMPDQELFEEATKVGGAPVYWEGAVRSSDKNLQGYLEMTGYNRAVGDLF